MGADSYHPKAGCFPDTVFEEDAMGRLDDAVAADVHGHLKGCSECSARAAQIERETLMVAKLVRSAAPVAEGDCPGEVVLAKYLDQSQDTAERESLEAHLNTCRPCQAKAVALYRELRIVTGEDTPLDEVEGPAPGTVPYAAVVHDGGEAVEAVEERMEEEGVEEEGVEEKIRDGGLRSWPTVVAGVGCVVSLAAAIGFPNSYSVQFQFLALAFAGFLGFRWSVSRVEGRGVVGEGPSSLFSTRSIPLAAAIVLYAVSWLVPAGTMWSLTGSFFMYLAWISLHTRAILSRASEGGAGEDGIAKSGPESGEDDASSDAGEGPMRHQSRG